MDREKNEEAIIEERKRKLNKLLFEKKIIWVLIALALILVFAWHTRTVNVDGLRDITTGNYTLGPDLDPYLFLRYAKTIVETGSLPIQDNMRYVPLGYDTRGETRLLPYMIALYYQIFNFDSVEKAAVFFPAFMFLLTVIAFFFFVRKVFDNKKEKDFIALISSLLLVVSTSLLARTVAGIPEKESAGFFFLFLSFFLFISAFKDKKMLGSLIYSALAGLSTALMGLIWGGWIYIFLTIGPVVFLGFVLGKIGKKEFYVYTLWLAVASIISISASTRYSFTGLVASTSSGLCFIVFLLLLIDFLIFETKIKNNNFVKDKEKKLSRPIFSLIIFVIVGIIISSVFLGIMFIPNFVKDIFSHLTQPYYDRLAFTVAENRQPYFSEWAGSFGPSSISILGKSIMTPPLLFWLFFIGSMVLFYESVKIENKERKLLTAAFSIFLIFLIFSRTSSGSNLNGDNLLSKVLYFSSFIVILAGFVFVYYKYKKENKLDKLKDINFMYLFLLVYFIIALLGARSGIRLIMALAPPAIAIAGYLCVEVTKKAIEKRKDSMKVIYFIIATIVIISIFYVFVYDKNVTILSAKYMVKTSYDSISPSLDILYHQQWQKAMAWVRINTPKTAVFAHWWDYGYWVQTIGERATVLDGGNAIAYWNHLLGRHVLTGKNEKEALEFLYTHNATYLLIDSSDIGKYRAYAFIGSDENYDRDSQMVTFGRDDSQTQELNNQTIYFYGGNYGTTFLDKDLQWTDNTTGKVSFFPAYQSGIYGVILSKDKNNNFNQPGVIIYSNNEQIRIPLRYIYFNNKLYDFKNGYGGCLYFVPYSSGTAIENEKLGLFITEKSMEDLWVKLYLFNNAKNFELIHSEQDMLVENINNNLISQNITLGDFVYYGGIRGPIKIWKINYPSDIKVKPEYLETSYPDPELQLAKKNF